MSTANMTKCANAPCNCAATGGSEYCSAYCAGAEERTDVVCHCGHTSCEGDATAARGRIEETESTRHA